MLDWLKNLGKDYPEFWKNYILQFEKPSNRKVAVYIETTGINPEKDRIVSIGALSIENNQIIIENGLEIDINKDEILEGKDLSYSEVQSIETLINFIGNSKLVGHRIHYDIEILNVYLDKIHCGRIKNELLDVEVMHGRILDTGSKKYSLKELLEFYNIRTPEIDTCATNAFSIALMFLKMKKKLGLN